MNPRRLFNLLIALIVAAGLLSAPFATPTIARSHHAVSSGEMQAMEGDTHAMSHAAMPHAAMSHAAMSRAVVSHATMSDSMMADGVPCCPDEGKAAKDCDSCPLLALCAMSIAVPAPSGLAAFSRSEAAETGFALPDDLLLDGLSARPPDHPPRTTV